MVGEGLEGTAPPGGSTAGIAPDHPEGGPVEGAHPAHALNKLLARGSAWAFVNYAVGSAVRLGSNLILWRLLFPDAFGLMAIVNVFIVGLAMFSDIGIGQAVVQNPRGEDPDFLNTIWTLQILRGLFLTVLASAAAVPVARFYHQPQLAWLIVVVAIGFAIGSFNSTKLFTASRRLAIGRLTLIDIASQVGSLIAMIAWAYFTRSVWALAVGSIVSPLIRLYLGFAALPGIRNRLRWEKDTVQAVAHFGRWIFLSTGLTFLASSSDRLIFGKLVSMDRLGIYSIALVWASFPTYIINHLVQAVMFPVLCRAVGPEGALAASYHKLRVPLLFAAGWIFSCLMSGGPPLVGFLYDKRANEAGIVVQLLAFGYWFSSLQSMNEAVILALGKPKWLAIGQAGKLIAMAVLVPLGAHYYGFSATVLALSLSEVVRYAISIRSIRAQLHPLPQDLLFSIGVGLTVGVGLLVRRGFARLPLHVTSTRLHSFLEGFAVFLVLSALWASAFLVYRRRSHVVPAPSPS